MADTNDKDVIDLLVAQHGQIKILLQQVHLAVGPARQQAFDDLVRLLAVHESAEEQVVHPASRHHAVGGEIVDSRLREEQEAKQVLASLYDLGLGHPEFDSRFASFAQKVIEHAELEEKEEFSELRLNTSHDERVRLASVVSFAEALAPTRPHPEVGGSLAANLLIGPPLAVFDRIRDAIRDWRKQSSNA
ncbi:hemerythrin domain-containing protein [Nocardia aurantiaca]|uniref:Hemerythrin domain-containing protein n=1 Tax=Nocardia aurantiaca TaxID=2675850 RepID=A0A6I3L5H1_9NOCA|nr:hemerythrin domain-containing protein [Nocardia aurantiaca]MTE15716.1 hemerythrin domain-containing protein [Nocardia aurantiaca]